MAEEPKKVEISVDDLHTFVLALQQRVHDLEQALKAYTVRLEGAEEAIEALEDEL